MEPGPYYAGGQQHYFGGGVDESNINPVVLALLIVVAILILVLRRKYLIYPFLLGAILIPFSQVIVIAGFHFPSLRLMILVGWARMIRSRFLTHDFPPLGKLGKIDKAILGWAISGATMFTILWGQVGALVNQLGLLYTNLGIYFLVRFLIRDEEDGERAIGVFAIISFIFGVMMLDEQITGHNVFGILGGNIPFAVVMREGKYRSQAAFQHPLLAGAFGGALVTLFIGLWMRNRRARTLAALGIAGGTAMAVCSMSSTSLITIFAGVFALCLWPLRRKMQPLRRGILATVILLHLVMKAPVWSLIARIDLTGGSSGYHRYELIDQAVRHFWDWWLVGTKTQSEWGWDMWDSIDWYVNEATNGGLITMILFIAIIVYCFKRIGVARRLAEREGNRRRELFIWALGATLFANALSFIGIDYYDQTIVMWLTFLAIIATVRTTAKQRPAIVNPPDVLADHGAQFVLGQHA